MNSCETQLVSNKASRQSLRTKVQTLEKKLKASESERKKAMENDKQSRKLYMAQCKTLTEEMVNLRKYIQEKVGVVEAGVTIVPKTP